MSVYTLSANGKESWKMIHDPRKNPDRHQNLIDWSLGHVPSPQNMSSKSICNLTRRYFVHTHTSTHAQTDEHTDTHKHLSTSSSTLQRPAAARCIVERGDEYLCTEEALGI